MLPVWARGCNLITGLSLGKGLDAGVRMLFPGSVRWGSGTPPSFGALYLLPPPHWEKSVDGAVVVHALAGCPGPSGRGQWVMQVCFWPRGRKGPKRLWWFSA